MSLPNPVAFTIFGHSIMWYGILIAAAVLAAIIMCMRRAPRYGMTADTIVDFALFVIPAAIIGARLYYVIFSWKDFASDPIRILYVWEGGLAFYGGLIGGVVAAIICCKVKKINPIDLSDLAMPAIALGQAIGRWGNFVNQEAYGVTVTNPSLQFFPLSVWIESTGSWHMATFFYESFACLLIAVFLLWYAKKKPPRGTMVLCYGLLYGLERAIVEGFRTDSLYLGPLRVSQVLSIALVIVCGILLLIRLKKKRDAVVEVDPNLVMRRAPVGDDALAAEAPAQGDSAEESASAEATASAEKEAPPEEAAPPEEPSKEEDA